MFKSPSKTFAVGVMTALVLVWIVSLYAQSTSKFVAHLSAWQGQSNAQGQAIFELSEDGTKLDYLLIAANITNITGAHMHLQAGAEDSPIVAVFYSGPEINGRFNGELAEGTITKADLKGPLEGSPLSVLITEMQNRRTSVKVHTAQYREGEIEGQIRPEERDSLGAGRPRRP